MERIGRSRFKEFADEFDELRGKFEAAAMPLEWIFETPHVRRIAVVVGSKNLDSACLSMAWEIAKANNATLSVYCMDEEKTREILKEKEITAAIYERKILMSVDSIEELSAEKYDLVVIPKAFSFEPLPPKGDIGPSTLGFCLATNSNVLVMKSPEVSFPFKNPWTLIDFSREAATAVCFSHHLTMEKRKLRMSYYIDALFLFRVYYASRIAGIDISVGEVRRMFSKQLDEFLMLAENYLSSQNRSFDVETKIGVLNELISPKICDESIDLIVVGKAYGPRVSMSWGMMMELLTQAKAHILLACELPY